MFKCFKDSLIHPNQIASHLGMKVSKFIFYFLFLVVFSSLPSIVSLFTSNNVSEQFSTIVIDAIKENKEVDYEIINNELVSKSNKVDATILEIEGFNYDNMLGGMMLGNTSQNQSILPIYLVFNPNEVEVELKAPSYVVNLDKEKISVLYLMPSFNNKEELKMVEMYKSTYENVGANDLDFTDIYGYSTHIIEERITNIVNNLFGSYIFFSYVLSIPVLLFSSFINFVIEVVMLSGIVFLFFRRANIKFFDLFKLVTFCMTPTVVISIYMLLPFGDVWYLALYILGQIITIVYFYKAFRNLVINNMKKE